MDNQEIKNEIQKAIEILKNDHIQENKFRLGIFGCQDIDYAVLLLEKIKEKIKVSDFED